MNLEIVRLVLPDRHTVEGHFLTVQVSRDSETRGSYLFGLDVITGLEGDLPLGG